MIFEYYLTRFYDIHLDMPLRVARLVPGLGHIVAAVDARPELHGQCGNWAVRTQVQACCDVSKVVHRGKERVKGFWEVKWDRTNAQVFCLVCLIEQLWQLQKSLGFANWSVLQLFQF
jgi:hypothetical protein